MQSTRFLAVPLLTLLLAAPVGVQASSGISGDIIVHEAFSRATPPGSTVSSVYFSVTNEGDEERVLVGAEAEVADVVELHTHEHDDEEGVHQMRRVHEVPIPAQGVVDFEPGGLHVMLIDLTEELVEGEEIDVNLLFDDGTEVMVLAEVRRPGRDAEHQDTDHVDESIEPEHEVEPEAEHDEPDPDPHHHHH